MVATINISDHVEAWDMVLGQLRAEMSRADFETWVKSLEPLGFLNDSDNAFQLAATNEYNRNWVESRLEGKINRLLSGLYQRTINIEVVVSNGFFKKQTLYKQSAENINEIEVIKSSPSRKKEKILELEPQDGIVEEKVPQRSKRKMMLQRVYGSERASIIQPERGMFETNYLWDKWVPLLGHSGYATIKAARRLCYWNPITGELRNEVETEMSDLAERAQLSVRTLKTMLNHELIKKYFIRYIVRRTMTPNGIRTAGITLFVRMDDPLTPEDQDKIGENEVGEWFGAKFDDERENYDL